MLEELTGDIFQINIGTLRQSLPISTPMLTPYVLQVICSRDLWPPSSSAT
jgi:hypothetical protein